MFVYSRILLAVILLLFVRRVLSVPAHAADLERIWSAAGLVLTSRSRRLEKKKVLSTLRVKLRVSEELESSNRNAALKNMRETMARISASIPKDELEQPIAEHEEEDFAHSFLDGDTDCYVQLVLDEISAELSSENIASMVEDILTDNTLLPQSQMLHWMKSLTVRLELQMSNQQGGCQAIVV